MRGINLIKKLRVNQEMTQQELAKACGVSQGTVAGWEKGRVFPKAGKIIQVANALHCDSALLLKMADARQRAKEENAKSRA